MTDEPELTISELADVSYCGRDTGVGLAPIFVRKMLERGWQPPPDEVAPEIN
jgi:hypothetical protein